MRILLSPLLFVLSLLYALGVSLDRYVRTRKQTRLKGKVVSIGNLTVGGTGKTPFVIKMAADIAATGKKPAILSRGYKGFLQEGSAQAIILGASKNLSDEVALMAEKCPTVPIGVGPNRCEGAARLAEQFSPDVYVLDDGFQHWPIYRDLDIVCVDATDPWGGGALLPLGRLREWPSHLRRAHVVVLTRTELVPPNKISEIENAIRRRAPQSLILKSEFVPSLWNPQESHVSAAAFLNGKQVLALSAIARPAAFEAALEKCGAQVTPVRYEDHHSYSERDLDDIEARIKKSNDVLITTEKDWMKLRQLRWGTQGPQPLFVFRIDIKFSPDDTQKWMNQIIRLLEK